MILKKNQYFSEKLSRIDGFLKGVSALDGKIRDFSAYAYQTACDDDKVVESIRKYYSDQAELIVDEFMKLENGLRDLEKNIRFFFLRNVKKHENSEKEIDNKRKYLSLRLIEMLIDVLDGKKNIPVFQLKGNFNNSDSKCDFFILCLYGSAIILQFNDDRPFKLNI